MNLIGLSSHWEGPGGRKSGKETDVVVPRLAPPDTAGDAQTMPRGRASAIPIDPQERMRRITAFALRCRSPQSKTIGILT
jgi:hypothetical protein